MTSPVLLILGAGPNIGVHVAKLFAAKGYKVALASRKDHTVDSSQLYIPVDLNEPESVASVFETVKAKLGSSPSAVVYNGALFKGDKADDPLSNFSLTNYNQSLNVNTTSVILALQQAVLGFRSLTDPSASKTFIFTGNILNVKPIPGLFTFGLTKNAAAYAIKSIAENKHYEGEGISFYYADERTSTGAAVYNAINGDAAAEEYWKLAERKDQGPWLYTFAKGEGYKNFESGN